MAAARTAGRGRAAMMAEGLQCHVFARPDFAMGGPHEGAPRGSIAGGLHGGGAPHPDQPITGPGDVWLLGDHRVGCGSTALLVAGLCESRGFKARLAQNRFRTHPASGTRRRRPGQHPRQTARVSALSRSRGHRRLSQAMCGNRGEGLRGFHPRLAVSPPAAETDGLRDSPLEGPVRSEPVSEIGRSKVILDDNKKVSAWIKLVETQFWPRIGG